LKFNMK